LRETLRRSTAKRERNRPEITNQLLKENAWQRIGERSLKI
jgi:hypothetical protein